MLAALAGEMAGICDIYLLVILKRYQIQLKQSTVIHPAVQSCSLLLAQARPMMIIVSLVIIISTLTLLDFDKAQNATIAVLTRKTG